MDIDSSDILWSYHMSNEAAQLQARIKELEARLEYQKKLSEELQTSLLFDSVGKVKNKRNKYRKDTPLKTYIKNHWNDADVKLKLAESIPGVTVGNISKQLLRSYLTVMYRNTLNSTTEEKTTCEPPVNPDSEIQPLKLKTSMYDLRLSDGTDIASL
jgi:hypothetical protein